MDTPIPSAVWIALAAFAVFVALVQAATSAWHHLTRRWTARARARHAFDGERRAEPMLRRAGYDVIDRQVRGRWVVYADGTPLEIGLRADLLVVRDGRRYVAEVKTGRLAPRLDHAPTRRQLLEYRMAFGVDGVLLVDAESNKVVVVELGDVAAGGVDGAARLPELRLGFLVVGAIVGGVVGWFLHA